MICTVVVVSAGVVLECEEATVPSAEGLDIVVPVPVCTGVLAYEVSDTGVCSPNVIVLTVRRVVGSVDSLHVRWGGGMIRRLVR